MSILPQAAQPLLHAFAGAFTRPTFKRFLTLMLGAVLTTPEVITQLVMFLPLQGLYEISIWVAWYWERKEKKRLAAEEAAEASENRDGEQG